MKLFVIAKGLFKWKLIMQKMHQRQNTVSPF